VVAPPFALGSYRRYAYGDPGLVLVNEQKKVELKLRRSVEEHLKRVHTDEPDAT